MTVSYLMHKVGKLSYPDEDMKLVLVWDPFATNNNAATFKKIKSALLPSSQEPRVPNGRKQGNGGGVLVSLPTKEACVTVVIFVSSVVPRLITCILVFIMYKRIECSVH